MAKLFRHHDTLRLFIEIARHFSFSDAAAALNMTKGAVSYQVKTLEEDLGVALFQRQPRGVALTSEGQSVLQSCKAHYEGIETALEIYRGAEMQMLTVGVSTYFASRWLSPRLMDFMQAHPEIQLRIQPMTRLFDLQAQGVDLAIRWGDGAWDDVEILPFMPCPAWPVGNRDTAAQIVRLGWSEAMPHLTLLRDHDDSNAWSDWLDVAGLERQGRQDALIVPDPNVRVQAVIDGQGIALNDDLVAQEVENGKLVRLSDVELAQYGYFLAIPPQRRKKRSVTAFVEWILERN
ncbi:Glycine cleavage system transcriptional activator [Roseovarius albus]|uniref:Glycine cleavage system transcriptional activator n=1 Tax=Roseovarius albus TaxID=1247867 RepID=A0A1X6YWV6_9RHOB|nr:LysR substrate-binding domain-containing protein [Roseovarius albus]SLN31688.1 Glycine cleavage system transcriptional activator [Roseovarius albus]